MRQLVGIEDQFVRILERDLGVDLLVRGNEIRISGSQQAQELVAQVIDQMIAVTDSGQDLLVDTVERLIELTVEQQVAKDQQAQAGEVASVSGGQVTAESSGSQDSAQLTSPVAGSPAVAHLSAASALSDSAASALSPVAASASARTTAPTRASAAPASAPATSPAVPTPASSTPATAATVFTKNVVSARGKNIRPKTRGQKEYVDAINDNTVVFGIGPAGTGKTYLAMAAAVAALKHKEVSRIILTRPAIEAGERLGFLPGTLTDKIDPYLRPLYDALYDMIDPGRIPKLLSTGVIEVAPLAYMRGRTLSDAFIVLDEAQNTSTEQMKMFLTRLGANSKMVVTGDITQIDLPGGARSGLREVQHILTGIDDIAFVHLSGRDVVRHQLVGKIVEAYGAYEESREQRGGRER